MIQFAQFALATLAGYLTWAAIFGTFEYFSLRKAGRRLPDTKRYIPQLWQGFLYFLQNRAFRLLLPGVGLGLGVTLIDRNNSVFVAESAEWVEGLPLAAQFFIAVFLIDVIGYSIHRFMHIRILWPMHSIHHYPKQMHWFAAEYSHPINQLLGTFINGLLIGQFFSPEILKIVLYFTTVYGLFIHTASPISFGKLDRIFVSPAVHHWHHAQDPRAYDSNFAGVFSCIDVLLGTYFEPTKETPLKYGVDDPELTNSLSSQLAYPWKKYRAAVIQRLAGRHSTTPQP